MHVDTSEYVYKIFSYCWATAEILTEISLWGILNHIVLIWTTSNCYVPLMPTFPTFFHLVTNDNYLPYMIIR